MEVRKIVVVVEDVEASRTALRWALHNFLRHGDLLTLLHVYSKKNKNKKKRLLRLQGFQLALSFKEICNSSSFFNTNVEIIVTEGEDESGKIGEIVRAIGASAVVVGLHDRSFMYRVLAIKHPTVSRPNTRTSSSSSWTSSSATPSPMSDCQHNLDVSQIEIGRLEIPETPSPRIPYRVCPDPYSILWRWKKRRKH